MESERGVGTVSEALREAREETRLARVEVGRLRVEVVRLRVALRDLRDHCENPYPHAGCLACAALRHLVGVALGEEDA